MVSAEQINVLRGKAVQEVNNDKEFQFKASSNDSEWLFIEPGRFEYDDRFLRGRKWAAGVKIHCEFLKQDYAFSHMQQNLF